jgi:hypothetical protein
MTHSTGWGGKRLGAGRKKSDNKKRSIVIRIDERLEPVVNELKKRLKAGLEYSFLLTVTNNQVIIDSPPPESFSREPERQQIETLEQEIQVLKEKVRHLEDRCVQLLATSQRFVSERDISDEKLRRTKSSLFSLKNNYIALKRQYDELFHQEYDCMAATGNGQRCSKKAVHTTIRNGLIFHVCRQHAKKLDRENKTAEKP